MTYVTDELRKRLTDGIVEVVEHTITDCIKPGAHSLAYETFSDTVKHRSFPELVIDVVVVVSQRQRSEHAQANEAFTNALKCLDREDAY